MAGSRVQLSSVHRALVCAVLTALVAVAAGPVSTAMAELPTVTSVTPDSGSTVGGTPVTITGSGFVAGATVAIGGNEASSVVFVSAGEITAMTPAGAAGPDEVVVTEEGVSSTLGPTYTYIAPSPPPPPAPAVSSVAPDSGPTAGGTPVMIDGSGFVAGAKVTIGGNEAPSTFVSANEITATTPAGAAGPGEVVVTEEGVSSTLGPTYTYIAPPPPPPPTVTLNAVAQSGNTTPSFTGTASDTAPVIIEIYEGDTATGSPVSSATTMTGGDWTSNNAQPALAGGRHEYTAVASQESSLGGPTGMSSPVTFTVDTTSPTVSLNQPASPSSDMTPSFTGSASDTTSIKVEIYVGSVVTGTPVSTAMAPGTTDGGWASGEANPALAAGKHTYTAVATQESSLGNPKGVSNPVTFIVDTAAPIVSLNQPTSSSSDTTPSFTGTASENTAVTVQIYAGATVKGVAVSTAMATGATGGGWISGDASPALVDGQYTAIASQENLVEGHAHVGSSLPVTFTVDTVPSAPVLPVTPASPTSPTTPTPTPTPTPPTTPTQTPPAAAFTWVPAKPMPGQSVALVSNSTDADSPITAFAWDLAGSGTFTAGGPVITTSFSTAGNHTVQLRVTDANGLTSVATQTIQVSAAPLVLMQPFPVVRIAGSESASGVKISLLSVQAPVGTQVSVACGGRHCPSRSESRRVVAASRSSGAGGVLLTFARFERSLHAGSILEIRVSKPGEIGKYTSFRIRPNKPPARIDACVGPVDPKPIPCPTS
jgi:hypothetical protein